MSGKDSVKVLISILANLLLCLSSPAQSQEGRVVMDIDPKALKLAQVMEEGGGTYSVLDSNCIVVHQEKELLIIRNGAIERRIKSPSHVSTFDINKRGNGVIVWNKLKNSKKADSNVYDIYLHRVKRFQIDPKSISVILPGSDRASCIFQVDMVNDSIVRITQNWHHDIIFANIDSLETNRYTVLSDPLYQFIAKGNYIGEYNHEFFFVYFDFKPGHVFTRLKAFEMVSNKPKNERSVELGELGRPIQMSCPVRYDEESGLFYMMLVQHGKLVAREFPIKDFAEKER
jgi:hypothetical protein